MKSVPLFLVVVTILQSVSTQDCPVSDGVCDCTLDVPEYGDLINCSSRGLVDIPAFTPSEQTWDTLLLDNNNLGIIGNSAFSGLRVRRILVEEAGVTGIEDGAFVGLDNVLEVLSFYENTLTENTILAIRDLPLLTHLTLDHNDITTLNESHFLNLPSLLELSLQFNQFEDVYPEYVANVPTLTEYDLYGNRISYVHNDSFSSLTELLNLDLGINNLKAVPTYSFRDLTILQLLSLWANDITDFSVETLSTLPATVEVLYLGQNDVSFLPEDLLNNLPNLRSLFLSIMPLDSLPDNIFASQSSLEQLDINDCNFDHVPQAIDNLPQLSSYSQYENQLTFINGDEFLNNPELYYLTLSDNQITFVNQSLFCNNPDLYSVDLDGNNIELFDSCAAILSSPLDRPSIDLARNPLFCGCDILWLHEREMIKNPESTVCAEPEALAGRNLTEIAPEEFQCELGFLETCLGVCN